jgi:RHS repeat-associated protein
MASRVSTLESSGFSYYDWDWINVLQEKAGSGTVSDRQVHGYAPIAGVGDIAHMDKSGTVYVPAPDQVGTTWRLIDGTPAAANSYFYDAFGGSRGVSEAVANQYRFAAKRLGHGTCLHHFPARQYSTSSGRFLSRDAMRHRDRGTDYLYAHARPTILADPTGLAATHPALMGQVFVYASLIPFARGVYGRSSFCGTFSSEDETIGCCKKVGIVQVHEWIQIISMWPDIRRPWRTDAVVPYSGFSTSATITWDDHPGLNMTKGKGNLTHFYFHDFESCVICFDKDRCGESLGCIGWGHEWDASRIVILGKRWLENGLYQYAHGVGGRLVLGTSDAGGVPVVRRSPRCFDRVTLNAINLACMTGDSWWV